MIQDIDNQIDKYVIGKLTESEVTVLEQMIANDPMLQEKVKLARYFSLAAEAAYKNQLREKFKRFEKGELVEEIKDPKLNILLQNQKWYFRIAAGIVLLIGVYWLTQRNAAIEPVSGEQLFASNFEAPAVDAVFFESTTRGDIDTMATFEGKYPDWYQAQLAYKQQKYAEALDHLLKIQSSSLNPDKELPRYKFQLGLLYMLNQQYAAAKPLLSDPNASNATTRQWYLALIALRENAPSEELKQLFGDIANDPMHPMSEKAKDILNQLNQ